MLCWPIAANAPSAIEAIETNTTICCHCRVMPGNAVMVARAKIAIAAIFGRGGEERRHRRRRALVDVRRPHVERHRRDLEAEAREQEHEAEDQPDAALRRGLGDAGERHVAGEAVDQRAAVQQHAGRQRAEHEILQARFGRSHGIAVRGGDHVERKTHQFEAEIERDQVAGRDQHAHADRREQDQDRIFEGLLPRHGEIVERHDDGEGRAGIGQDLHEAGEVVDDEARAEDRAVRDDGDDHRRRDQQQRSSTR